MSIYVLDVQYIKQNTESNIRFPFKPSGFIEKQKQEEQLYNNNVAKGNTLNGKATKSLDANRRSIVNTNFVGSQDEKQKSNSIIISWSVLKRNMNHKGFGKVVFFAYKNLANVFKSKRSDFQFINPDESSNILLSDVVSVSLGRGHNSELDQPVVINFHHYENISSSTSNRLSPACVSWNADLDSWHETGCRLLATNITTSVCECDHLGNFALLMQNKTSNSPFMSEDVSVTSSGDQGPSHVLIAEVITYIAVALSIILVILILFKVSYKFMIKAIISTLIINLFIL